jgi:hypothetical protein
MRIHIALVVLFALTPSTVGAQVSTVDGVRALLRGDARTAVQILTPLTEAASPDPLAQFFLALSYQSLHGIENKAYACRLFLRSAVPANPLAQQAQSLAARFQEQSPAYAPRLCAETTTPPAQPQAAAPEASSPPPQTDTDKGVDAFMRGDYPHAAGFLEPIAERITLPYDPIAGFFMAAMYDSGRGVAADPMRACALYERAASGVPILPPAAPFVAAAEAMRITIERSLGKDSLELCRAAAIVGFDHRFEPITFVLEPDHWIAFALNGVTITYRGASTLVSRRLVTPGTVFLPIQHTVLDVGPTRSTRRHFIEVAHWNRSARPQQWTLTWQLFEVPGNQLISVVSEQLLTITAAEPPAAFDLSSIARLRVNDAGRAERVVSGGPSSGVSERSQVIPTEEERREAAREDSERQARLARAGSSGARDPQRVPGLALPNADGCGFAVVYGWSDDRTEGVSVQADVRALQLSATPRTFDLASHTPGLVVMLHVYEHAVGESPMCTDVGFRDNPPHDWHATSGTVTIELSSPDQDLTGRNRFRAIVHIVGAEFVDGTGQRVHQTAPIVLTAAIGRFFG